MTLNGDEEKYTLLYSILMVFYGAIVGTMLAPTMSIEFPHSLVEPFYWAMIGLFIIVGGLPIAIYLFGLRIVQGEYRSAAIYFAVAALLQGIFAVSAHSLWGANVAVISAAGVAAKTWALALALITKE